MNQLNSLKIIPNRVIFSFLDAVRVTGTNLVLCATLRNIENAWSDGWEEGGCVPVYDVQAFSQLPFFRFDCDSSRCGLIVRFVRVGSIGDFHFPLIDIVLPNLLRTHVVTFKPVLGHNTAALIC